MQARTDRVLFERIIANFVSNALRYTHQGGVVIGCRRRAGRMWLEVCDTGIGIPEEKLEVIFEEFRQLANPERSREKGSGLGLAIVRKTALLLGLDVQVRSRPGRGSTFAVEVPLGSAFAVCGPAEVPPAGGALVVALVEDDLRVREALAFALQADGHRVIDGASCLDLLDRLESQSPDVVIADYRLANDETGLDAVAAVRAAHGEAIPAVILTGETGDEVVGQITPSGLRIVHKPVHHKDLQRCLAELVGAVEVSRAN
jgi:CheY-like chemotaxis protein